VSTVAIAGAVLLALGSLLDGLGGDLVLEDRT